MPILNTQYVKIPECAFEVGGCMEEPCLRSRCVERSETFQYSGSTPPQTTYSSVSDEDKDPTPVTLTMTLEHRVLLSSKRVLTKRNTMPSLCPYQGDGFHCTHFLLRFIYEISVSLPF